MYYNITPLKYDVRQGVIWQKKRYLTKDTHFYLGLFDKMKAKFGLNKRDPLLQITTNL